jgi:hypothetical protein
LHNVPPAARVSFTDFSAGNRVRLIRYFRERVRQEAQEGWSDDLERYAAEVAQKASLAEYDKEVQGLFRTLRWTVLAGPVFGLACWACLRLYAAHLGLNAPPGLLRWPGWSLLDWILAGALIGAGILASLRTLAWVCRPDS